MHKTRVIETAIDSDETSYIFSDKKAIGWDFAGLTITNLISQSK